MSIIFLIFFNVFYIDLFHPKSKCGLKFYTIIPTELETHILSLFVKGGLVGLTLPGYIPTDYYFCQGSSNLYLTQYVFVKKFVRGPGAILEKPLEL